MIVHTNDAVNYTSSGEYCGIDFDAPDSCGAAGTRTDKDENTPAVIWFLAAFPDTSSPAVTVIQFGIDHNLQPGQGYFENYEMCGSLELPDPGWPETGFGNLVSFGSTIKTDRLFPFYVFAVYGFEDAYFGTTVYPSTEEAKFVDDSAPPVEDLITRFGIVRWYAAGSNECPSNGGTEGGDGSEGEEGEDQSGQDSYPEGEPTEIVCLYLERGVLDDSDRPSEPTSVEKIEFARSGLQEALVAAGAKAMWAVYPNRTSADTVGVDRNGNPVKLIDLSRFYRVSFSDPMTAEQAVPGLLDAPGVQFAYVEEMEGGTVSSPNDEHYESIALWPPHDPITQDAQWHLRNDGQRIKLPYNPAAPCGQAVAGEDIGAEEAWDLVGYGSEHVVIGLADTGILGGRDGDPTVHPDLNVVPLDWDQRNSVSFHPDDDWCTTHGTRDAGLAAARTNNVIGVAGVCGNCKLLEINISRSVCNCGLGNDPLCNGPDAYYYQKVENAANLSLASDDTLLVVNMPFIIGYGTSSNPTAVASLWNVHARGIALTAASGNGGQATTVTAAPANIPFVLGVGGSTWEGRFWDKSTTCYQQGEGGTTVGYGEFFGTDPTAGTGRFIDVCAPASGFIATTESLENTTDSGLYWLTSSSCSGASSQVAGAIGLIQSAYRSRTGSYMSADDAIGIIEATASLFRIDPLNEPAPTCTTCTREQYGRGILDLHFAVWMATDGRHYWDAPGQSLVASKTQNNGLWNWEQVQEFTIPVGENAGTWVQYRATAGVNLAGISGPPEGDRIPQHYGWVRRFTGETTSFAAYPLDRANRIELAQMGVRDCQMRLIAPDGTAEIVGYAYARRLEGGGLSWLGGIDENTIQMAYVTTRYTTGAESAPDAESHGPLGLRVIAHEGRASWRIGWRQSQEGDARLVVYDVGGRIVVSKDLGRGGTARRFEWDGRSNSGTRVPSGIYWVGIEAEGQRSTKKCLLIR